ncbi:hypothetical protein [Streptomyces sp. NPDC046821]|uniref:hypothetical protein n=1 Tax=Streptomyces sp. NPDC046821 TaxID=3154702 RepID=UPI0033E1E736
MTSANSNKGRNIPTYCGIGWAERTHGIALVDDSGQLLAKRHITDDAAGYEPLLDLTEVAARWLAGRRTDRAVQVVDTA